MSSSDTPLQALLREHMRARESRSQAHTRLVTEALTRADDLETNCVAAVGKGLNSSVANQAQLEVAVKQLRAQVVALSRRCSLYSRDYAALAAGVDKLGAVPFLEATGATLARVNSTLAAAAAKIEGLTGE